MLKNITLTSFVVLSILGLLSGCGNNEETKKGIQSDVRGELSELQSTAPSAVTSLISAFGFTPSSNAGAFLAFYSNKRYFSGVVQKLAAQHYRIAGAVGYYEEVDGVIKTTGKKTSCPEWAQHKGKAKVAGSVQGSSVVVTAGSVTTVLNRVDVSQASTPAGGLVIQWGCFDQTTGAFSSHSWSDIP